MINQKNYLGEFQSQIDSSLKQLQDENIAARIWDHDYTVWKENPEEITNRLGWLDSPNVMHSAIEEIERFVDEVRAVGFRYAVLLGMGGSSLAPEVFRLTFGVEDDFLNLSVLDSTHPEAILKKERNIDISKTLFVVSTKSGGTIETMSFMKFFYNLTLKTVGAEKVGRHFVAITDPGSGLESMAKELRFRKIFLNDPNIGGRYSALSYFGLVPAALTGMNIKKLLDKAKGMADKCKQTDLKKNPGVVLGTIMGEMANRNVDKVTIIASPQLQHFGVWVEQLIAESTGKEGKGILPIEGEFLAKPHEYGEDRLFIYLNLEDEKFCNEKVRLLIDTAHPVVEITLKDLYDLGAEFFRWEFATIIASIFLNVNPFDQPNVESAKILAKRMVKEYHEKGKIPQQRAAFNKDEITIFSDINASSLSGFLSLFFDNAKTFKNKGSRRCYVALQAFIEPNEKVNIALENIRTKIQKLFKLATTLGYGPRFLHSTGQLHKGDAGNGLFIQFTANIKEDASIPDTATDDNSSISFGTLVIAQALGDRQALLNENRKVIRFDLGNDILGGLSKIFEAIA